MGLAFLSVAGLGDGEVEKERDLEVRRAGEAPRRHDSCVKPNKPPTWSGCR